MTVLLPAPSLAFPFSGGSVRRDGKDDIEIIDLKHKRKFLSRMHYPALGLKDILIGGKVTIYSRQYRVADFDDEFTRDALGKSKQA